MKHFVCSIVIDFDAETEDEALDEFMNYLTELKRDEVTIEEVDR